MSFRKRGKNVEVIKLPDNCCNIEVEPKKGVNTLYWWAKGDDESGWYVKAELYGVDGENLETITAETFLELRVRIIRNYGFKF